MEEQILTNVVANHIFAQKFSMNSTNIRLYFFHHWSLLQKNKESDTFLMDSVRSFRQGYPETKSYTSQRGLEKSQ